MAQPRLRAHIAPPGGHGLRRALEALADEGTVVTSWANALLLSARASMPEGVEATILPWGEWVRRVAMSAGIAAPRIPSQGHLRALASLASRALPGSNAFERSCRMAGAHAGLVSVLSELRAWSLTAEAMREAAGRAGPSLAERLTALATLDELVRDSMDASKLAYAADIVDEVVAAGPLKAWPCSQLVVLAGQEPHPRYEAFVRWSAAAGLAVTVVVEAFADGGPLFGPGQALVERLKAKPVPGLGPTWHRRLFGPADGGKAPRLRCVVAPDPLAEAEWAVRLAAECEAGGAPPAAIVAPDMERYGPLALAASRRFGVPVTASLSVPLAATGFARFCRRLLLALARQDGEALASLASEDYLSGEPGGQRWPGLPADFRRLREAASAGEGPDWLAASIAWSDAQPPEAPLRDWLAAFRELVGECLAKGTTDPGHDGRAMALVQQTIAEYAFAYDIAGEQNVGLARFAELAAELWQEGQVVLPQQPGGIPLARDPWSLGPLGSVVVVGTVEGSFPRSTRQDPALLDEHRAELASLTGAALATSRERAAAERDAFVRLCGSASQTIVLSRPRSDGERKFVAAVYVSEARRALGGGPEEPLPSLAPEAQDAALPADARLRAALDGPRRPSDMPTLQTEAGRSAVRLAAHDALDPEEAQDFVACPLRSVLRHRVPMRAPTRAGTGVLLRIPVRVGLPAIQDLDEARRALEAELAEVVGRAAARGRPHEVALLQATGRRWIEAWLAHEQASREQWPRERTTGPVTPGGDSIKRKPKLSGDETVELAGQFAALIEAGDDVRVVLYRRNRPKPDDEAEAVYRALVALAASARGRATFFEVDSVRDGRWVDAVADTPLSRYRPQGRAGLKLGSAPEGLNLTQALLTAAKRAQPVVEAMRLGAVAPRPGDHCRHCPVIEVCRWHEEEGL